MPSYGQGFCPIARASELFARPWTPIIVRNLLLGCSTFGEILEGAPGLSRSVLTQRLRELERHGVVSRESRERGRGSRYELTEAGRGLEAVCNALGEWGERWHDVAPRDLDPGIVLWAVGKCMERSRLPERRVVVRFDLRHFPLRFWLLVQRPEPELCRTHPGADEDLVVTTDPDSLAAWHMGRISLDDALAAEKMTIAGTPALVRAFRSWGGQTPFAEVEAGRP